MKTLFASRLLIQLANRARASDIVALADDSVLKAKLALSKLGVVDVKSETLRLIGDLWKPGDVRLRALEAFWAEHSQFLVLNRVRSRLMVNPPRGIDVAADLVQTLSSALGETYGSNFASNPVVLASLPGDWVGKFEDVVVFWDCGPEDAVKIADSVFVGSTLTLVRPHPQDHDFWIESLDLNFTFSNVVSELEKFFLTEKIFQQGQDGVEILILGLKPKVRK